MTLVEAPLTQELISFSLDTRYEDLSPALIAVGRTHILDSLGCGLAGSASPAARIAREYLSSEGGVPGECTVIGSKLRRAPRSAAFLNALSMHADDFDDTGPQPMADRNGGIHATVPVLAVVLALGEIRSVSGAEALRAIHVGVEVSCKLNHAMDYEHYRRGYHSTATIGMFGATAAAGIILGLNAAQMSAAFGIVASQSAGLRANFGSMMNPFHAGHVAECAVVSAELAVRGFTSSPGILDNSKIGYFHALGGGFDASTVMGKLGNPWAFLDPGMWIKPFPCGALTHPALTALIELAYREDIDPDRVCSVEIMTNQNIVNTLIHNRPVAALQAKFSMPFAAAVALIRRRVSLGEFSDEVVNNAEVRALMDKVSFKAFESQESDFTNVTTLMNIEMIDGRRHSLRADFGKGNPRNPMLYEDVAVKFRGCADFVSWPREKGEKLISLVSEFERMDTLKALSNLVANEA